jgi:hypothetical protein
LAGLRKIHKTSDTAKDDLEKAMKLPAAQQAAALQQALKSLMASKVAMDEMWVNLLIPFASNLLSIAKRLKERGQKGSPEELALELEKLVEVDLRALWQKRCDDPSKPLLP